MIACFAAQAQTAPQLLPYTSKLIAGGGKTAILSGSACPVSGLKATDAYGDGCLGTEIEIGNTVAGGATPGARSAVADSSGNVFFTDYNNGLVRRVDVLTGIVTAVAGGASASPAANTACGANLSLDAIGDGCLGTAVKLSHPAGIAFAPNGDLYFSDIGYAQVRKIAATAGAIPTTGVISLVAGNVGTTFGYAASTPTTTIVAATQSYLRSPFGIAFDTKGDLFIVDEYTEAIVVVNTNATGTNTVNGVPVAAGTVWKIAGTTTGTTAPYCVNGTATGYGCSYGLYVENVQANTNNFDSTYSVAVDASGTVYAGDEYYDSVFKITPAGILSTFAGIQNAVGTKPTIAKRGPAGSFGVGSIFGVAADASNNVYFTDSSSGVIWRVDGAGLSQYVVAGGATTVCAGATDTSGDGCPALQSMLGHSGTGNYATATLPGPGAYGISVDANANLYFGDTETNLVREIASGTQFGQVGAGQPTQTLEVHFAPGDTPAAGVLAYALTAGITNFALGTASCTTNSDKTTDCLLPVTATPSVLGPFTGTLTVKSTLGGVANITLSGVYVQSPVTRTSVSFTTNCGSATTYSPAATFALTATLTANGPANPGGTMTFFANGIAIGNAVNVINLGSSGAPVYGATINTTFATLGTYTITAKYSGDSYFNPSSGTSAATITTVAPSYSATLNPSTPQSVTAGQTALYSFNLVQNVYSGTLTFACSNLPMYATCSFSPPTIAAAGCTITNTVALSILTQAAATVLPAGIGSGGVGRGPWQAISLISMVAGFGLALLLGLRRRRVATRLVATRMGGIGMMLALLLMAAGTMGCGKVSQGGPPTPSGSYMVTVTVSGTTGTPASFAVALTVK